MARLVSLASLSESKREQANSPEDCVDTVQGGPRTGEPGLLPRTVDVMFNSIEGRCSAHGIRPARLTAAEIVPRHETVLFGRNDPLFQHTSGDQDATLRMTAKHDATGEYECLFHDHSVC